MLKSINVKLILIIVATLVIQSGVIIFIESRSAKKSFLENVTSDVLLQATSLQHTLSYIAQKDDRLQLQETIASLGSDVRLDYAYLLDESGRIIAATKVTSVGEDVFTHINAELRSKFQNNMVSVREKQKAVIWLSKDQQILFALSPVLLGRSSKEQLRNDRVGVLFKQIDLSWISQQRNEVLLSETIPLVVVFSFIAVIIFYLLKIFITRRINQIYNLTEEFQLGSTVPDEALSGNDELARLSRSFLDMANNLNRQHDDLLKNKQLLLRSQEMAHLGSWELDLVNDVLFWSDEVYNIFGLAPDNVTPSYEVFLNAVHPDDRELVNGKYHDSIKNKLNAYEVEHRIIRASDGEIRYVLEKCIHLRDKNAEIYRSVGMVHDITEQKTAEKNILRQKQETQQILDCIVDGVISIESTGEILSFNPAAEDMFGYKASEIVGKNISELVPEGIRHKHSYYVENYGVVDGVNVIGRGREIYGRRRNGEEFPMRISVAELPDAGDGKKRFIGTCMDLSLIKLQDEKLRQSQKMDALGSLTGGLAHDFNNIIGVVLGYAEFLQNTLDKNDKTYDYATEIFKAAERARNLTSKLLGFSRSTDTNVRLTNINEQLLNSRELLQTTLSASIELRYDLDENLWFANLDNSSLDDAILNVCINAKHAMPDGGTLQIETRNLIVDQKNTSVYGMKPGEYVSLKITDTGIGMDADTKQKVFDPFFTTKGKGGTGLGLSQVYGMVQRANGMVNVESALGKGSSITMIFPRFYEVSEKKDIPVDNHKKDYTEATGTILVVDDEEQLRQFTVQILANLGYHVLSASDGHAALDILKEHLVDLLISDVTMPGMSGYQLAELVAKNYPGIPIQLITGYTELQPGEGLDPKIHNNRLMKPFTIKDLQERVHELLSTHARHNSDQASAK